MSKFIFDSAFPSEKSWWKTGLKILGWTLLSIVILLTGLYFGWSWLLDKMWH